MLVAAASLFAQTTTDYGSSDKKHSGLFDPSKLTVQRSISFGMAAIQTSNNSLLTQSMYSTRLLYKVAPPVTLKLDFGLPIYSNYATRSNISVDNIQSLDYFRNIPFEAALSIKPRDNLLLQLSVAKNTGTQYGPATMWGHRGFFGESYWDGMFGKDTIR